MKGHFYKPNCKCSNKKKCNCNATWYYVIDAGKDPKTGKRKQMKKGGFKTKKEAQKAVADLISSSRNEVYTASKKVTFGEFREEWLSLYFKERSVKTNSLRNREKESKRFLRFFENLQMRSITAQMYQDAIDQLREEYAFNTLSGTHVTGQMIFSKALDLKVITSNPSQFVHVHPSKQTISEIENTETLPKILEKEELKIFLETARLKGLDQDYPIFFLLSYTGLRVGELCALKWSDIDFQKQTLRISKTYYNAQNNTKKFELQAPKTKESARIIDIDENVITVLLKHKHFQDQQINKSTENFHDHNFVFTNLGSAPGYPLYQKMIGLRMKRLLKLSGLNESFSPHTLRHTHTSLLAEAGVSLEMIMKRLGHKDEKTTRDIYLHFTRHMRKEASTKFKNLMDNLF